MVPVARKKAHSLTADELSDLPVSEFVSLGLSEEPFCGIEHAWKPQASMREMHLYSCGQVPSKVGTVRQLIDICENGPPLGKVQCMSSSGFLSLPFAE